MSSSLFPRAEWHLETAAALAADSAIALSDYSNPYKAALELAYAHAPPVRKAGPIRVTQPGVTNKSAEKTYRWLPFAAERYNISEDLSNYVIVPVSVIVSELPNRNLVAFSFDRLTEFNPELGMLGYESFRGKPTFTDHCFPAEAPVLTPHGECPIASLRKGDYVVTDKGRNRRITRLFKNGVKSVREIDITGYPDSMLVTDNHPLFTVDARQVYGKLASMCSGTSSRKSGVSSHGVREDLNTVLLVAHERPASDVYVGDYVRVPQKGVFGGKKSEHPGLCFLVGVYAAEGSLYRKGNYRGVTLTIGAKEHSLKEEIVAACEALGYPVTVNYRAAEGKGGSLSPSVCNVHIKSRVFHDLCGKAVGAYSDKKSFKPWVRALDRESLLRFIGGYMSGDGYLRQGGKSDKSKKNCSSGLILSTVSRAMAADLFYACISLGLSPLFMNSGPEEYMNGFGSYVHRRYKKLQSYHVRLSGECVGVLWPYLSKSKTAGKKLNVADGRVGRAVMHSFWNNGYYHLRVRDVNPDVAKVPTFNIEVEQDHTYICYGVSVHNCNQDYTRAKGVILDVGFRPLTKAVGGLYKVVNLCAFDRSVDPVLASSILKGETNQYSMGAMVNGYRCSICTASTNKPTEPKCGHIPADRKTLRAVNVGGKSVLAHWFVGAFRGFETSALVRALPGAFPSAVHEPQDLLQL